MGVTAEATTAGRDFARRFTNTLVELQLQTGIHRRIETYINDWSTEHANLRATYISRELDSSYLQCEEFPPEAIARPKLQALAIAGNRLYELVAFAHGFRRDVVELSSIAEIQETLLEPTPEEPFVYRATLFHRFPAATVLIATNGDAQDAAEEFVGRLRYVRGW